MIEPPAPVVATPTANVIVATAATLTPTSRAPCGFAALARIARPVHVRVRKTHSATSTPTATRHPYTCALGRNSSPTWKDWLKYGGGGGIEGVGPPHPTQPPPPRAGG